MPRRPQQVPSTCLGQIEKDDHRRIADGAVVAGELKAAGLLIDLEDGDVVGALIATIKELTCGIEVEAPRVVASCPFFAHECELAACGNRKDPNAVVQPVARIDELSIGGNQDF